MAMDGLNNRLKFLLSKAQENPTEEVAALLAELDLIRERNPLMFFEPYERQAKFLSANQFTKAFFGGNRAGKTEIGVVDDLIQCVDREALPRHLHKYKRWDPPFYCRIVAPKFKLIEDVILEKLRALSPKDQLHQQSFDKAYSKTEQKLKFSNGSWIIFNTGDQDVDQHAGVKLHRVHFDEEPEGEHGKQVFRENIQRLADLYPNSQAMFTMTPLFGLSWTYDEVWERRDEQNIFCIQAAMFHNPHVPKEFIENELKGLSAEERRARIEGNFVHFHGQVLGRFTDKLIVPPPDPEHVKKLDIFVGIDPGISQAGVVFTGFDRDNVCLVFDEIYPREQTVPQIALEIKSRIKAWGLDPDKIIFVIDPSARNRTLVNAESVEGELAREGVYTTPGQNDRLAGVLQLRARIDAGALLVSQDCQNWLMEVRRWVIAKDEVTQRDEPNAKGSGGTFATKGPDHLMDPTRYVAMERVWYEAPKPEPEKTRGWVPGFAPTGKWLQGQIPETVGPMGTMS